MFANRKSNVVPQDCDSKPVDAPDDVLQTNSLPNSVYAAQTVLEFTPVEVSVYKAKDGNLVVRLNDHEALSEVFSGIGIFPQFVFGSCGKFCSGTTEFLDRLIGSGLLKINGDGDEPASNFNVTSSASFVSISEKINDPLKADDKFKIGGLNDFISHVLIGKAKPLDPLKCAFSYNGGVWRVTPIREVLPGFKASEVEQVKKITQQGGAEFDDTKLVAKTFLVCTETLWEMQKDKKGYTMTDSLFVELKERGYFAMFSHDYRPELVYKQGNRI